MKKYAPKKVFILENNEYIEITYEELCRREENNPSYGKKMCMKHLSPPSTNFEQVEIPSSYQ